MQPVLKNSVVALCACAIAVRCRADLTDDNGHLVALEQALGLGRGRLRIDAILGNELDLAAHDAAGRIDLVDRERDTHHRVLAQWTEKAGARRQVPEADRLGLAADDGGKPERSERGCGARSLQYLTTTTAGGRAIHDSSLG